MSFLSEKVSIIIPTYRRSIYIVDAVESCLNQKESNIEIIVVDDNGKDTQNQKENEKVLKKYIDNKLIKYICHEKNMNGSVARNTGIKFSTGNFITFLDDDDWYEPDKTIIQLNKMKIDHSLACICGFNRIFDKSTKYGCLKNSKDILVKILSFQIDSCAGSTLILDKNLIEKIGIFDETFLRHQDIEFLYRIAKETKISIVEKPLVNIRMHNENIKAKPADNVLKYRQHFLKVFKDDIDSLESSEKKNIYDNHYFEIAKAYIKNYNIKSCFIFLLKTSNPVKHFMHLIKDTIIFVLNKRRCY